MKYTFESMLSKLALFFIYIYMYLTLKTHIYTSFNTLLCSQIRQI